MIFQTFDAIDRKEISCTKCDENLKVEGPANLVRDVIDQIGWIQEEDGWVCPNCKTT